MIATHHIKVNGRWYNAGDELPEAASGKKELKEIKKAFEKLSEPNVPVLIVEETPEKPKEEQKKAPARRKAGK